MTKLLTRCMPFGLLFLAISLDRASAQDGDQPLLPASFSEQMPLYTAALGSFTRPISSKSEKAQAYFDQGFQLRYAFAVEEAAQSFHEAQKHDSTSAICYWGEAWAWGSYLNRPLTKENAPRAYAAIQKAIELSEDHANLVEKALIDAMAIRYVQDYDPETRAVQDTAYANIMRIVHETYPEDLDVATLYAEALFLLEPRRGTRDIEDPDVKRIHRVLEGVLAADIRHSGACHLYIHATESTSRPDLGEACAEYLGNSIPGASHINHMPSHTWNEVGRWGDGVRANIQAWHSDQKAEIGEGIAIYPSHNLHMLLFAASMDGQGAVAIQAAKDYAKVTGNTMYLAMTLVRFGRFDEVVEIEDRPEATIPGGMWDFAQGYARLRNGEADFARVYLNRVLAAADSSQSQFRRHSAKQVLGTLAGILEGEMHRDAADLDAAIKSFERAVSIEDRMIYDEPEPLPFAARHWLGTALLEANRYEEAERVYREELADHPNNGWSLFGLMKALGAQGKSVVDAKRDFDASWARSEMWIRASRY